MASNNCIVREFHELDQLTGSDAVRLVLSKHASLSSEREREYYNGQHASVDPPLFSAAEAERLDTLYNLLNSLEFERAYLHANRIRVGDQRVGTQTHEMMLGLIYKFCPFDWTMTQFIMEYLPAVDVSQLIRSEPREFHPWAYHPEYP
jgi:hypothetical protein